MDSTRHFIAIQPIDDSLVNTIHTLALRIRNSLANRNDGQHVVECDLMTDDDAQIVDQRDHDLRLAARIGQQLLEHNTELQSRNEFLESQLATSNDTISQLKLDLSRKLQILHDVNIIADDVASPINERRNNIVDELECQLRHLETTNRKLMAEHNVLKSQSDTLEWREKKAIADSVRHLNDANRRIDDLHQQLFEKTQECNKAESEVCKLLADIKRKQQVEKELMTANEEIELQLSNTMEQQRRLAVEVLNMQERYSEVVTLLEDTQAELRKRSKLARSNSVDSFYESLASELEASDSGFGSSRHQHTTPTKNGNLAQLLCHHLNDNLTPTTSNHMNLTAERLNLSGIASPNLVNLVEASTSMTPVAFRSRQPSMSVNGASTTTSASSTGRLSRFSSNDSLADYKGPSLGQPGMPGTRDLEWSIRRRALQRRLELDYALFLRRRTSIIKRQHSPEIPPKVSVFKPIEGSRTLSVWKALASPPFNLIESVTLPPAAMKPPTHGIHIRVSDATSHLGLHEERMMVNQQSGGVITRANLMTKDDQID